MRSLGLLLPVSFALAAVFGACGLSLDVGADQGDDAGPNPPDAASSSSSSSSGAPVGDATPGTSSSSGALPEAGACDLDPLAAACIDDGFAVFVKGGAEAGGTGSKSHPFGSLGEALGQRGERTRVYVCQGELEESVHITDTDLVLAGGLDCTTWAPTGGDPSTHVLGAQDSPALDVDGVDVRVFGIAFEAPAASAVGNANTGLAGRSSIAAWVHGGTLTATRSRFVAGAGTAGQKGADRVAPAKGGNGGDGSTLGASECGAFGGRGGDANARSESGVDAVPLDLGGRGCPWVADGSPADPTCVQGGSVSYKSTPFLGCGDGKPGAGGSGAAAPASVIAAGRVDATGWLPSAGTDGITGGRGGGGGGAGEAHVSDLDQPGGAGGSGGCGGPGGQGGGGGGASIAVLVQNASFTARGSTLATAAGGNGGPGGGGANGSDGGNGKDGPMQGCTGGAGGGGGGGSGGQGGAAGLSAGIVWSGAGSIQWDDAELVADTAALAGVTLGVAAVAGDQGDKGDKGAHGTPTSGAHDGTDGQAGIVGLAVVPLAAHHAD